MVRILFAGLFAVGVLATASAGPPAMFRADAQHQGSYPDGGVPLLHGVRWKFRTGAAVVSTPAIGDGTVYFGSNDHNLYALDAASGARRCSS